MSSTKHNPILVLGLGNTLLGDDGIGIRLIRELRSRLGNDARFEFETTQRAGLYLLDHLLDRSQVILIDAVTAGEKEVGEVCIYNFLSADHPQIACFSPHYVGLPSVLALGRSHNMPLPQQIWVVGIAVADPQTVRPSLSPPLEEKLAGIVAEIENFLLDFAARKSVQRERKFPSSQATNASRLGAFSPH